MTAQRTKNGLALTTAFAAAALLLSGCGASKPPAQAASETSAPTASSSDTPSSAAAAGTDTAQPTSTPPAPAPPRSGAALCKTASLTATADSTGGGAAGSVNMQLILTNSGAEPCLLTGFAGVSLAADANGEPIGAAATRDDSTTAIEVLLAPGQAGTATLRYTQAGNYPDCARTPAAGFRIYPPEDTESLFLADPRDACSNTEIDLLTIGAFQAK